MGQRRLNRWYAEEEGGAHKEDTVVRAFGTRGGGDCANDDG
jgi:hypothetical protein